MLFRPGVMAEHKHWQAMRKCRVEPCGIGAEPDEQPPLVHYQTPMLRALCGTRGAGWHPQTRMVEKVTCGRCLAEMDNKKPAVGAGSCAG